MLSFPFLPRLQCTVMALQTPLLRMRNYAVVDFLTINEQPIYVVPW